MLYLKLANTISSVAWAAALSLLTVAATGCSGGYALAPVNGTVTIDGKPLADATVTFNPIDAGADAPSSFGRTDEAGKFSLNLVSDDSSGALVGKHKVVVAKNFESSSDVATPQERAAANLPPHDITFEVKSGSNDAVIELDTKKGKKK